MGPVSDQAAGMRSHSKLRGVEGKECSLLFLPFWNDTPGVSWSIVLWQAVLLSVFSRLFQGLGICGVYPLLTATPIELIAEDRGMWSPSGPCGFSVSDTVFFLWNRKEVTHHCGLFLQIQISVCPWGLTSWWIHPSTSVFVPFFLSLCGCFNLKSLSFGCRFLPLNLSSFSLEGISYAIVSLCLASFPWTVIHPGPSL